MKITQADAPTIRMDCHPIQTIWCSYLCHPHHFYAGCPSWYNPPNLSWLGTGTKYVGLHTRWLAIVQWFKKNTSRFISKFAAKYSLKMFLPLKCLATLPCDLWLMTSTFYIVGCLLILIFHGPGRVGSGRRSKVQTRFPLCPAYFTTVYAFCIIILPCCFAHYFWMCDWKAKQGSRRCNIGLSLKYYFELH